MVQLQTPESDCCIIYGETGKFKQESGELEANVSFVLLTVFLGVYYIFMCVKIRSDSHIEGFADVSEIMLLFTLNFFNVRCRQ